MGFSHHYRRGYQLSVMQRFGIFLGFLRGEDRTVRLLRGRALTAQLMQRMVEQSTDRIVKKIEVW